MNIFHLFLGHPKQPKLPLVRLRIFYPQIFEPFSVHRFGHRFVSKIANNKDIILFSRKKVEKTKAVGIDHEVLATILRQEGIEKKRVEDLVKKYFEQTEEDKRLLVLSEIGVSSAVQEYVDKEVKEAMRILVEHQMGKTKIYLKENVRNITEIEKELAKFREERKKNSQNETTEFQVVLKTTHVSNRSTNNESDDELFEDETVEINTSKRGRGRGRGSRGTRGARGNSSTARNTSATSKRATSRAAKNDVEETGSKRTRAPRNASKQTNLSSYFQSGANGNDIDDDSDEDLQPKRKKTTTKANTTRTRGRGIMFDFSD